MTQDPKQIAAGLSEADLIVALDLPDFEPWSAGSPKWKDYESRCKFIDLGLAEAVFPHAKPGDSGPQLWRWSLLGLAVRNILKENEDGA